MLASRLIIKVEIALLVLNYQKLFPMLKLTLLLFLFSTSSCMSTAQEISSHKWKNRVLIVLANDLENPILKKQVEELKKHTAGLIERKLIVYISTPQKFKQGLDSENWEISNEIYSEFKDLKSGFEIILVGLDGGIKSRNENFTPAQNIFALIDGMPMRRQEIRKQ